VDGNSAGAAKRCDGDAYDHAAAAFRFLRQPSRPNAPRSVAKSGRAAGSGVHADDSLMKSPGDMDVAGCSINDGCFLAWPLVRTKR
jgi:hypothetical protein